MYKQNDNLKLTSMEDKMKIDSIESQSENKSTNVENKKKRNGRKPWWQNPLGCLYQIIGFIMLMFMVSGVRTCVRSSLSTQTAESQIQSAFEEIKDELPQRVDDVTKMVDAKFTDESLIFVYEIDDSGFDIRAVNKAEMKSNILAEWGRDSDQKKLAQFCVKTNRSVVFKYRSATTDYTISLTFTPSELKSKI